MHVQTARAAARSYLASHRMTRDGCAREIFRGYAAPGQPGYTVKRGTITVPGLGASAFDGTHTFATNELFDEIEQGQGDMFGGFGE